MRLSTTLGIAWPLHSARSWRLPWYCALLTAKKHESNKASQRKCERLVKPLNWSIPNHNPKYKNQSRTYPFSAPWLQSLLETQAMMETQEQLPLPPAANLKNSFATQVGMFLLLFHLLHTLHQPKDSNKTGWMRLSTGHRIAWPMHPTWSRRLPWHSALLTTQEEANKTKHMKIGLDVLKQDKSQSKVLGTQPIYANLSRNVSSLFGDASGNPGDGGNPPGDSAATLARYFKNRNQAGDDENHLKTGKYFCISTHSFYGCKQSLNVTEWDFLSTSQDSWHSLALLHVDSKNWKNVWNQNVFDIIRLDIIYDIIQIHINSLYKWIVHISQHISTWHTAEPLRREKYPATASRRWKIPWPNRPPSSKENTQAVQG